MYIVVTDCEYRAAVSLVQALGEAGHTLILCHSRDMAIDPPAFHSRYAAACHEIDAKVSEPAYLDALEAICRACPEMPVLLPAGAKTTALIAREQARFDRFAKTLVAPANVLDAANDKETVQRVAAGIGVPTPKTYTGTPDAFPVIVKPRCGEKLGLKAEKRYARADNAAEFAAVYAKMKTYDNTPVVQAYIAGEGVGVCAVLDKDGNPAAVLCHRRVREYPVSGGPSSCCESVSRSDLLAFSEALVQETGFTGPAMFEFKCAADGSPRLLEVNPRVWGTFPLTRSAKTDFAYSWFCLAANLPLPEEVPAQHVKMAYYPADFAAGLGYLKAGQPGRFFAAAADFLSPCVKNGIADPKDPAPAQVYFRNLFHRGGHK